MQSFLRLNILKIKTSIGLNQFSLTVIADYLLIKLRATELKVRKFVASLPWDNTTRTIYSELLNHPAYLL